MPNRSADTLFQLIKSLQKSEKRNFKLYIKRNSGKNDLKIITLFDAMDRQADYDEDALIKRNPTLTRKQLPNLKAHLYRQILVSLRLLQSNTNPEVQFHEQLDFAKILYSKGLYHQSLRTLDKAKQAATDNEQLQNLIAILEAEKKIESLHITRSLEDRANEITEEVENVAARFKRQSKLSNLALRLYGWYIKNGMARNEQDEKEVKHFFKMQLTDEIARPTGFYERLYYFQIYCWYAFIRQDYLMYYRYTKKWVEEFENMPQMIALETGNYIKGVHNLLNAHFNLRNFDGFNDALRKFEEFSESDVVQQSNTNRMQVFVYLYIAKINKHFLEGTFDEGLELVDFIVERLDEYELFLDKHRTLVFYYKIASLYFGSGDFDNAIHYLNKIINWKVNLRSDLQCYARLLHLIAHYELGNFRLIEYLIKSVYRYMAKMQNLSQVEEAMFAFLRTAFRLSPREIQPEFENLLNHLKTMKNNKFETRAFAYLDIISWLESKVENKPVQEIIIEKFVARKRFEV